MSESSRADYPHVVIKQIAWDGWEAFVEHAPLIRAIGNTPVEAMDDVLAQLAVEESEPEPTEER